MYINLIFHYKEICIQKISKVLLPQYFLLELGLKFKITTQNAHAFFFFFFFFFLIDANHKILAQSIYKVDITQSTSRTPFSGEQE